MRQYEIYGEKESESQIVRLQLEKRYDGKIAWVAVDKNGDVERTILELTTRGTIKRWAGVYDIVTVDEVGKIKIDE